MKSHCHLGWLEGALWLLAAICSGLAFAQVVAARSEGSESALINTSHPPSGFSPKGILLGRLEILQVGLAVPIVNDYDSERLARGVGHVPGSALPGGLGNLVLAGHRDTFFRPLRNVRSGMKIEIVTSNGRYPYLVDSTEVVSPEQVRVLDIGERPELTLITCFPFDFVGAAPKRFIVHAHLLSVDAA